eukprot:TRINITY_DN6659_c0_g1_i2.p1 TRINITY_DN6659_c0_g1~~TRINITY_DN6659_c0_g1_i2.p1  ORF type:complete len:271 (+),score=32.87 TRINITY_DN6659_c0_g1_i2:60-815(+)
MVAAGDSHSLLLRSDGTAVACGDNGQGQCDLPALEEGTTYTQVAAGGSHSLLLRSDGTAVACGGHNISRFLGFLPALEAGTTYTQVAAGNTHVLLLTSDGIAKACGGDPRANRLPALEEGTTYTQVAAGGFHSLLLRSDGTAVACGANESGQSTIPPSEMSYVPSSGRSSAKVALLASLVGSSMCITTAGGDTRCQVAVSPHDRLVDVRSRLAQQLGSGFPTFDVISPNSELMSKVLIAEPDAFLSRFMQS